MFLQNVSYLVDATISNLCFFFSGYKATDVTEKFEFIERSTEGKLWFQSIIALSISH